jgi:hypothetical protein
MGKTERLKIPYCYKNNLIMMTVEHRSICKRMLVANNKDVYVLANNYRTPVKLLRISIFERKKGVDTAHIFYTPRYPAGGGVYSICPFVRECFPHCLCNSSLTT